MSVHARACGRGHPYAEAAKNGQDIGRLRDVRSGSEEHSQHVNVLLGKYAILLTQQILLIKWNTGAFCC